MLVLVNNWSDEARAASLAVRRAKARARAKQAMIERKREAFFEKHPDASEADWILEDEKNLREWRDRKDFERWQKRNPGGTREEWEQARKERMDSWRKRKQARERVQFEKQKNGKRRVGEPFVRNWVPRYEDGAVVPSFYDEESDELIELPRDAWPDHLREDPALKQGEVLDPHWGAYGPDAPYGYHDGTGEPREEPLYDAEGYPILPRFPLAGLSKQEAFEQLADWEERSWEALDQWGRWGQRQEWFQKHPNATEDDWREYNRKKYGDGE